MLAHYDLMKLFFWGQRKRLQLCRERRKSYKGKCSQSSYDKVDLKTGNGNSDEGKDFFSLRVGIIQKAEINMEGIAADEAEQHWATWRQKGAKQTKPGSWIWTIDCTGYARLVAPWGQCDSTSQNVNDPRALEKQSVNFGNFICKFYCR